MLDDGHGIFACLLLMGQRLLVPIHYELPLSFLHEVTPDPACKSCSQLQNKSIVLT